MKLALAQIDMRLGDIEGICGRIEDQARLTHERGARVLCVPAPLFMGALPGGLVRAADFEHDMLAGLTGVAERIQELDMICIVPAAVSFEGQPLLDYMMLKDGRVVPARASIALQRGENNDARWAPPVFDVDGVRIAVIFDLDRELEMLPTGVDLIAYFQFNAFDMTDRETAAVAAVRSGAYRKIASKRSVWFACMAPVGAYDESVYTGGSFVLDDCGRVVAQAPCFEESLLVQEIQRGVMLDALEDHELPEFRSEEWLWQALVLAVRDNARAHGTSRAVVALEGDLPSSLLAALAVDALGPRNVIGLVLGRNRIFTPAQEEAEAARCAAVRAIAERLHIRTVERDAPDAARVLDRRASALAHAWPHAGGYGARAGRDGAEPVVQNRVRAGGTRLVRGLPGRLRALWRCVPVDARVCGARAQPYVCRGAAGARNAQRGGGLYGARAGAGAFDTQWSGRYARPRGAAARRA